MVTAISDIRTVPVGEDLTKESLAFSVIRGLATMNRVDKKVAPGVSLVAGEWGVLQNDGTMARAGATAVPNTYPVFAGTDRFDAHATGNVTLVMASKIIVKTNKYDVGGSYAAGVGLTVKDLGLGESMMTPSSGPDPVLARVIEVGDGYIVYEVL